MVVACLHTAVTHALALPVWPDLLTLHPLSRSDARWRCGSPDRCCILDFEPIDNVPVALHGAQMTRQVYLAQDRFGGLRDLG